MSGTSTVHDTPEVDSPTIHKEWTGEYPAAPTQKLDDWEWTEQYGVHFEDRHPRGPFFPLKLLQHIFTKELLSLEINALEGLNEEEKDSLVGQVLGSGNSATQTYIQVFAILKSFGQLEKLPAFIRETVSDQELPLIENTLEGGGRIFQTGSKKLFPDHLLDKAERRFFCSQQYMMVLPFFDNQPQPQDMNWTCVLPYYKIPATTASKESYRVFGIWGSMSKIFIHPHCHAFCDVFNALKQPDEPMFFALKRSFTHDPDSFRTEVEMLQRFRSTKHPHVVTILAAFTTSRGNYLIFPWATHNLHMYWRHVRPKPDSGNVELVRWISHQTFMLVEAMNCIHDVHEDTEIPEDERSHGRHGDLKPWNILWHKSRQGLGKLVIADVGLNKLNRFTNVNYSPRGHSEQLGEMKYRSPELDYANDLMGRTLDVWAMGCVFFEILLWLHKNHHELVWMEARQSAPSIHGSENFAYYEWVYVEDAGFCAVRLKEAVSECIRTLRKDCSQFTNDFLDIIEDQMLVVDHNERISAKELLREMKDLDRKCIGDQAYCIHKEQRQPRDAPKPKLQRREFSMDLEPRGKDEVPRVISGDGRFYNVI
ncbi:hypothetical protein O1611_g3634 [Lasiodiplodia mahajangana]|uniref:Uncharacterized protein n=1 Tax=Lasiodiplodia mahajangana TaxID=1108764 RepID=A0ACC2JR62_9PEZI|nr:hypothetical protein O1611_g3634 [Lasiodiplodia mahajangana]